MVPNGNAASAILKNRGRHRAPLQTLMRMQSERMSEGSRESAEHSVNTCESSTSAVLADSSKSRMQVSKNCPDGLSFGISECDSWWASQHRAVAKRLDHVRHDEHALVQIEALF